MSKFINEMIDKIDESWYGFIEDKEVINILNRIEKQIGTNYYPETKDVLRFLETDFNNVKYVIVGMDPYPTKSNNQIDATGRSFEVKGFTKWGVTKRSSLNNILKAIYMKEKGEDISIENLREKIDNKEFNVLPPDKLFNSLEKQGFLFLNYGLTVEPNKPESHIKYWEAFSNKLNKYILENNPNVKWFLWGDKVQHKLKNIIPESQSIKNCHPRNPQFPKENPFEELTDINFLRTTKKRRSI